MFKLVPILLAFAALTHADADADCEYDCEPIYTIQSDPFNLVLTFGTQGILSWTIPYDPYPIDLSVLLQPQDIVPLSIAQLAMTYSGDGSLSFDNNDILNFQNPITWGAEKPEMDPPSCVKVGVKRMFV
ncbi:hypothetical protein J4E80_009371 [Alternaria sp. BMP 0032]|nr:hypothetical protein J4E80_009371 [Alternaria sp. BMP 0032]